jgi:hypothetical protein
MFSLFKPKPTPKNTATSTAVATPTSAAIATPIVQKSKPKIVSLIFSHNNRMQCFMERFKQPKEVSLDLFKKQGMKSEKIRFKNGAIIKLVVDVENDMITPSLVYEGELDEKETKKILEKGSYYTKNNTTKISNVSKLINVLAPGLANNLKKNAPKNVNGNIIGNNSYFNSQAKTKLQRNKGIQDSFKIFNNYFEPKKLEILKHLTNEKKIDIDSNKIYEFYIIRHGQGIHNGVSKSKKIASVQWYKDATLTAIGKEQARNSGVALNKILVGSKVNYLFATDLRRTRETLVEVLGKLTNQLNLKNPNIIILPCSHEIFVEKDKNGKSCDEVESNQIGRMAVENFPVCVMGRGFSLKGTFRILGFDKDKGCKYQNSYPIDWSYYLAFYNNTMRGIYSRSESRLRCRDTNMIIEALNIIKNGSSVLNQYKRNIEKKRNNYSSISQTNNGTASIKSVSTLSKNELMNKYIDSNLKLKVNISNLKRQANQTEKNKLNKISKKTTLTEANLRTIHSIITNMKNRGVKLGKLLQGVEELSNAASIFSKTTKQLLNQQKKSVFS